MQRRDNIILIKADAYSDRIIKLYRFLSERKHEHIMSKQIFRSGTSIGANIIESKNAQSQKDFVNKLSIALKEADETLYWLHKLYSGEYITEVQHDSMCADNEEIVKLLTSIIKTMKERYNI